MRFSVWLHANRWPDLLATARHAAATGWDGIWFGDEPEPALECSAVVAALSVVVAGVRVGAVVDADRDRHPAAIAKTAATIDHLSGGRLMLGLAAGSRPDAPARLEEASQVVKSLVSADRTTFGGRFYELHDAPLDPKPLQQPFPLLIQDEGNTTVELAARHATHWLLSGGPEAVTRQIETVRQVCRDIGRSPAELAIAVRVAEPSDRLERYRGLGVVELVIPEQPPETLDRIITELRS